MKSLHYNFDSIFSRLFIFLMTIFLFFSVSEIFFYYKLQDSITQSRLQPYKSTYDHWPRPYVMAAFKPDYPHNALGYINTPAASLIKVKPRIIVLGGSTVATNSPTISEALQSELAKKGVDVDTYNLGVSSSVSRQDLIRILIDSTSYKPDLIIHYGGGNDITYGPDSRLNYPHRYFLQELDSSISQNSNNYNLIKYFILGSSTVRYLFPDYVYRMVIGNYLDRYKPKVSIEEISNLRSKSYVQNLKLSKMVSNFYGFRFLAFFQPLLYYKTIYSQEERSMTSADPSPYLHWRDLVLTDVAALDMQKNFIDLSHIFENTESTIFRDRIHFSNNDTNKLIAQLMAPHVIAALKTKPPINQMGATVTEFEFMKATSPNDNQ